MISAKVRKTAEIACWCVGIALIGLYFALRADGEAERQAAVLEFMAAAASPQPMVDKAETITRHATLAYGAPDKSHWSKGRLRKYEQARTAAGMPVAILRIRRLGLEVPVYSADTARNMNRGAVLIEGTALPDTNGNTAIAAHRDGYFRALKNVVVGDVLTVQTVSMLQRFRVVSLEIVKPTDISVLRQTPVPAVTLVTCYPFYFVGPAPQRYIVRAVVSDGAGQGDGPFARKSSVRDKAVHRGPAGVRRMPAMVMTGFQDWRVIAWEPIARLARFFQMEPLEGIAEVNAYLETGIRSGRYSTAPRPGAGFHDAGFTDAARVLATR